MTTAGRKVFAGFIPLTDSAPLIVAREIGFAAEEGIDLYLTKETSWATIRDRLAVGLLDVAHALAPMPIASNLGLNPLAHDLIAPIALGSGGNTVVVSNALWERLDLDETVPPFSPGPAVEALARAVSKSRESGQSKLSFGIVHPHSAHHYELAYWLAVGGILPAHDVDLVVIPPPLMPAALQSGRIDGFCVGEPWGSLAANRGPGRILTTKAQIWRSSPEKVLAASRVWFEEDEDRADALLRAIHRACQWCDQPGNRAELSVMLASENYIGLPAGLLRDGLERSLPGPNDNSVAVEGFLNFSAQAATFPWVSHALWFYSQMVRWGQIAYDPEHLAIVRRTYRPDLFRRALRPLGIDMPSANAKIEGTLAGCTPVGSAGGSLMLGTDRFFDGRTFDPDHIENYIAVDHALPGKLV